MVMASGRKDRQKDRDRERERALLDSYGERSFPAPCPGDTLPWNLAKHQRVKRSKSASGSGDVLDPAERAVIRIAGRQSAVCSPTTLLLPPLTHATLLCYCSHQASY
ncbi:microtubule-actin cross-linking factor 1-like [Coregonus clupeaformis]|uniref:microtubule-actin cross-linking factor 1-like n=1 Tax=Coregonus clupeaformis TaxID=59861 RepID=UPI001BE0DF97|nr:microtubule-actin cross-linking factor 1-like [Coregonus clupeaformis]